MQMVEEGESGMSRMCSREISRAALKRVEKDCRLQTSEEI